MLYRSHDIMVLFNRIRGWLIRDFSIRYFQKPEMVSLTHAAASLPKERNIRNFIYRLLLQQAAKASPAGRLGIGKSQFASGWKKAVTSR
jgi:hypothetical protein